MFKDAFLSGYENSVISGRPFSGSRDARCSALAVCCICYIIPQAARTGAPSWHVTGGGIATISICHLSCTDNVSNSTDYRGLLTNSGPYSNLFGTTFSTNTSLEYVGISPSAEFIGIDYDSGAWTNVVACAVRARGRANVHVTHYIGQAPAAEINQVWNLELAVAIPAPP